MIRKAPRAAWIFLWIALQLDTSSTFTTVPAVSSQRIRELLAVQEGNDSIDVDTDVDDARSTKRRNLILGWGVGSSVLLGGKEAMAATLFSRLRPTGPSSLYVVTPGKNATDSMQKEPLDDVPTYLSSEVCLLKLLPVKNPFFRQLEASIESVSSLRTSSLQQDVIRREVTKTIELTIADLDDKRNQLEPVFNPEDSTLLQITKGERGEQLIESFRNRLVELAAATRARNETGTFISEKNALYALSEIGELLVSSFPYDVPSEGKFSYLPRLLGRARVTFTFRRENKVVGNVTIVADGFAAPITAGNFVDLSIRNFYTGLPLKFNKKKLGTGSEFEVANVPILGSYEEGFYDPLTAKPRRLPLEIIRNEKASGVPKLSYSQGLTNFATTKATLEPTVNSKPLLSFKIPGLVAMNHPDRIPNGGSSEFFSLQMDSMLDEKRGLLDGEFAPLGYIVDGYDIFQHLQAGDVISNTVVDEWGRLNLVKLRESSFSEAIEGSGEAAST
jgi:peptidylprolyl isomerase